MSPFGVEKLVHSQAIQHNHSEPLPAPHRAVRIAACLALAISLLIMLDLRPVLAGVIPLCEPADTPTGCTTSSCQSGQTCLPRCVKYFPHNGSFEVLQCECVRAECHATLPALPFNTCVVPDNGNGTVHLPPTGCAYRHVPADPWQIIDGLPPGTTIDSQVTHTNFICDPMANTVCSFLQPPGCFEPGGSLGGEKSCASSTFQMNMSGTGNLGGYARNIPIPLSLEIHAGPRLVGDPVQSFPTDMFRMFGQITGDPDFDLLRIVGGTDFGLPSPGHTTLTQLPGGNWAVDSFFDITYRIDFVGAPGGPLAGMSGSTTGTVRMSTGDSPRCEGDCEPGFDCNRIVTVNQDGSVDICCECTSQVCEPAPGGQACLPIACPDSSMECTATCVRHNPATGQSLILECECRDAGTCHAELAPGGSNACVVPDNGNGTVHLPPTGCAYRHAPNDPWQIIDGLPALTTIDCDVVHANFLCDPNNGGVCSFLQPPGCFLPGGSLGGEKSCAVSNFQLQMNGTGALNGYFRNIGVPIAIEWHTAPRILNAPVQEFPTDCFRLFGQIVGDPDFDLLRFVAGTDFGLPSPGHTTLTQLPGGDWAVDSFFDITYRIDFVGAPGSVLQGMSGSTTGTVRMSTGGAPACVGGCPSGSVCRTRRTVNPDGTIDTCCDCILFCSCLGDMNGDTLLNGLDIQPFVDCIVNYSNGAIPQHCACADINEDGMLTGVDVQGFVDRLLASPKILCPGPR